MFRRWLVGVLVIVGLIGAAWISWLFGECQKTIQSGNAEYHAEYNSDACQTLQALPLSFAQSIGSFGAWLLEFSESHDKAIVALGTVVIAAFTGILGIATIFLWKATDKIVAEAKRASIQQSADMQASVAVAQTTADAALKSADAAKESAAIARRTMIETDRAWITLRAAIEDDIKIENGSASFTVKVTYKNVGKAPATQARFHNRQYSDLGIAQLSANDWDGVARDPTLENIGIILWPNDESSLKFSATFLVEQFSGPYSGACRTRPLSSFATRCGKPCQKN